MRSFEEISTQAKSKRILKRDCFVCWYCGGDAATMDHKRPVSRGGDDSESNLVAACRSCNSAKCAKTVEEFRTARTYPAASRFTKEQREFWNLLGVELPTHRPEKPHVFYGETNAWFRQLAALSGKGALWASL